MSTLAQSEFPRTISGLVAFTHHLDGEPAIDVLWLEEFGEEEFFISVKLFDELGIEEGERFELQIDRRAGDEVRMYGFEGAEYYRVIAGKKQ